MVLSRRTHILRATRFDVKCSRKVAGSILVQRPFFSKWQIVLTPAVTTHSIAPMLRHDFAERDGVKLHYAAVGEGELILFAHGFPEFWYAWKNQLEEFVPNLTLRRIPDGSHWVIHEMSALVNQTICEWMKVAFCGVDA